MDSSTSARIDVRSGTSMVADLASPTVAPLDWRASRPIRPSRLAEAGLVPASPSQTRTATPARTNGTPALITATPRVGPSDRVVAPRAQDAATRVLIVDDHTAFCDALAMAIDMQDDLVCIGGAASLGEAMAIIDGNPPDVILMDVHLPDGDGIEATTRIRDAAPDALILILTGHADAGILARAAAAGASGFLPKESPIATVLQSIRAVRRGAMMIDGAVLATLLERMVPALAPVPKPEPKADDLLLTQRERDVLQLMAEGQNSHAIAIALNISLHTCRGYQKSVMAKLDAHSQLEAVVMATRRHLVRLAV